MSKLLKLKEWLTVLDASRHLSILFEEEVGEADVLRLALDGHLRLSVRFLEPSPALCGRIITVDDTSECFDPSSISDHDEREDRAGKSKRVLIDRRDKQVLDIEGEYHVEGVWDLLMRGGERSYVEDQYQNLINGPRVYPYLLDDGIYLVKQSGDMACRLRPELPDGGIPNESFLVVRTAALHELETRISDLERREDKPLIKRERDSLLIIIAALAKLAKLDLTTPSATAKVIESQIALLGSEEPKARAIENHINRAAEVLGDRS